jgi:peptidoglycan/LPS O-acetylase OafA/YrhL
MPSGTEEVTFSEPAGRPNTLVQFAAALAVSCLYVHSGVVADSTSNGWSLVMAVGSALSGAAESLPEDRRRTAGVLRLTAVLALLCLLVAAVLAPELVVG